MPRLKISQVWIFTLLASEPEMIAVAIMAKVI